MENSLNKSVVLRDFPPVTDLSAYSQINVVMSDVTLCSVYLCGSVTSAEIQQ